MTEDQFAEVMETFDFLQDYHYDPDGATANLFGKKRKKKGIFKKIGNAFKKIGKFVDKNVKSAIKDVKGAVEMAKYVPLLPFKGSMKKQLRRKGISAPDKIDKLAEKFYSVVIQNNPSFEFDNFERDEYGNLDPVSIGTIVSGIINFFKNIVEKLKKAKESLPPEIRDLAKDITKDSQNLVKSAEAGGEKGVIQSLTIDAENGTPEYGGTIKSDNNMIFIIVGVVALLFIMKK